MWLTGGRFDFQDGRFGVPSAILACLVPTVTVPEDFPRMERTLVLSRQGALLPFLRIIDV
jgi:hypothetical protein